MPDSVRIVELHYSHRAELLRDNTSTHIIPRFAAKYD